WVNDPADIYFLTRDQLETLPGFKERSIDNLLSSIEGSKDRPIWRLLVALNIRHVGAHVAQVVARAFPSVDLLAAATEEEIDAVEEIGPEIARSAFEWFHDSENFALLEKLRKAGVRMEEEPAPERSDGPLSGTT